MNEENTANDTELLSLKVIGMGSSHCVMTVEKAIKTLSGIESVDADFSNQTVKVTFDKSQSSAKDIEQVITDAGYESIIAEENN